MQVVEIESVSIQRTHFVTTYGVLAKDGGLSTELMNPYF
jgi:hypothetical protein